MNQGDHRRAEERLERLRELLREGVNDLEIPRWSPAF